MTQPSQPHPRRTEALGAFALILLGGLSGCAGEYQHTTKIRTSDPLADTLAQAQAAMGARVSFHYSDYFTLASPNPNGCAGDAKNFYDPLAIMLPTAPAGGTAGFGTNVVTALQGAAGITGPTGSVPFPQSQFGVGETIRPSFIKNISVDMTDSNANTPSNLAFSCSLGNSTQAPPVSGCATFDYGAIGGIPTSLGGTLLMIGGVQGYNYAGILPATLTGTYPFRGETVSCGPVLSSGGATSCGASVFALGVNTLAASVFKTAPDLMPAYQGTSGPSGPVSTWANLSGAAGYAGPQGSAGSSVVYDSALQKVLLFGGAAPLAGLGATGSGQTTYDTWLFDLKSQSWEFLNAGVYIANSMMTQYDTALDIQAPMTAPVPAGTLTPTPMQLPKPVGARALFGYVPVPGMAINLDKMTSGAGSGIMDAALDMIDKTDRLLISGGVGPVGTLSDTHRFNPTYGPDIADGVDPLDPITETTINLGGVATNGLAGLNGSEAYQWIDSFHTQLLNNSFGSRFVPANATDYLYNSLSSQLLPDLPPLASGPAGGSSAYNSAFAPLVNNTAVTVGGVVGTGYLLSAGGFDAGMTVNYGPADGETAAVAGCTTTGGVVAAGTRTLNCGGGLSIQTRMYTGTTVQGPQKESNTAAWGAITNYTDTYSTPSAPAIWTQVAENTTAADISSTAQTVPWVGGATMLPGFDLQNNDVLFFGGLDCKKYVDDSSAACTAFRNPGRYWQMGGDPGAALTTTPAVAVPVGSGFMGVVGTTNAVPTLAGMASARGLDPNSTDVVSKVLIVAWGGAASAGTTSGQNRIYYMYKSGVATYAWAYSDPASGSVTGDVPAELINSSMVFSHVTGKFYVFGGYEPGVQLTRGDTYELSITSTTACTVAGTCTFKWKKLNTTTAGLTCYPTSCPPARRSHRIAEVNYYNRNPGGMNGAAGYTTDGEQPCVAGAPCSYGIFMEGGSPNGLSYLSDRWMFDPTANGGAGHWQLMGELPPRTLSSMASLDYATPTTGGTAHRAILFGGETGLHSPEQGRSAHYYVAPTLGDTWMFDYDNKTWNRVQLLGKGYDGEANIPDLPELELRQGYNALAPAILAGDTMGAHLSELSPPPLSGAIMVTRTMAPPAGGAADPATPLRKLALPEVYLIGGRLKSGLFNTLDHVYKFCAGSTGESFVTSTTTGLSVPNTEDYTCDAYDVTANPSSPSPSASYVGRWLRKGPTTSDGGIDPVTSASFMGAGAYDPVRDRIVVVGGLTPALVGGAVTDTANISTNAAGVFEYWPPSPQLAAPTVVAPFTAVGTQPREGRWSYVPSCAPYTAPSGRYGHSLGYDTLSGSLVMSGGFDTLGQPLTQTITYPDGRTYDTPEVWAGTYYSADIPNGDNNTKDPGIAITNAPCYYWKPISKFGNSIDIQAQAPPQTGLAHAASVYIPASGYNTGYYSMFDNACEKAGPIATPDPSINKLLAGGAYIDIDRSALGATENLLLNVTYIPLGTTNRRPDSQTITPNESAVFRVHLIKTGQSGDYIRQVQQPRYMTYAATDQYPQVAQSISVIAPPTGQIMQEQIMIPLSADPTIDRIRIERYSGTGILLEASLFRMGAK